MQRHLEKKSGRAGEDPERIPPAKSNQPDGIHDVNANRCFLIPPMLRRQRLCGRTRRSERQTAFDLCRGPGHSPGSRFQRLLDRNRFGAATAAIVAYLLPLGLALRRNTIGTLRCLRFGLIPCTAGTANVFAGFGNLRTARRATLLAAGNPRKPLQRQGQYE